MMETAFILATLGLAQALAVISPGPSFLVVARTTIAESRLAGSITALGLGLGSVIWASGALFGLTSLFKIAPWTYQAVAIAGGVYLIYLAVQLWRHAPEPMPEMSQIAARRGTALLRGMLTQLSNPKPAIFFGSIFVTMLPPHPSVTLVACVLPMVFVIEVCWYVLVACLLSSPRLRTSYARAKPWIDRGTGGFLGILGFKLIAER